MSDEVAGYQDFEFDLPGALLANLIKILDKIQKVPLTPAFVAHIPEEQGIYQLFLDEEPIYVGKTDDKAGLYRRLSRHSRKILQRRGLDTSRVSFKAVRIYVFTAIDVEGDLIRHYGGVKGLGWNGSGFGSNDPGRERDTTKNKPDNFDYQYPADIDIPLELELPASAPASIFIEKLKEGLSYTVRAQRGSSGRAYHADIVNSTVSGLAAPFTVREIVAHITRQLPPGWQATKLLGYVILYKEEKDYPQAEIIARSE